MPGTRKSPVPLRRFQQKFRAREMRNNPTPAEALLWEHLRRNQLGVRFRRQHNIDRFVVDFYCAAARLVIEVVGPVHEQPNADQDRQARLETLGLRVLRVTNEAVLGDMDRVIACIRAGLTPQEVQR